MATTTRLLIGWWVLLSGVSLVATAQAPTEQVLDSAAKGLENARSEDEMDTVWRTVERYRHTFVGQVDTLLRNSSSRETKVRACHLLGSFRDAEPTDDLAKNIDLEAGGDDVARWGRYPCGEALYTIGKAAEPALLLLLMDSESETKRELALQTLVALRGRCGAAERLRQRLDGISEQRSSRLQRSLHRLDAGAFEKRADFPRGASGRSAAGDRLAKLASSSPGFDKAANLLQNPRSIQDLDDAVGWAEHRRHEVAAKLIDLLQRTSSNAVKARACFLLGKFGATEAIPILIHDIKVPPTVDEFKMIPAWGAWPCESALYTLGTPAEQPLLDLLAVSDDAQERFLAVGTLQSLRGRCGAAELVRNALAGERGSRAAKLEQALQKLDHPAPHH